ncbi:MAG: MarR family winged helix-turn-helix transcriptional regulator [Steroidobacteraceae bacterium]
MSRRSRGTAAAGSGRGKRAASVIQGNGWLDEFVPYQLYRVTNKLNARLLKRLKSMRINSSQWRVLSVLRAYGPMSIGGIVETTLMEQPTTSRVVAQLEREGHVGRRLSDRDSRVAEIWITAAGLQAFEHIVPAALKHQSLAFQNVSAKETAQLVATLRKIEKNIAPDD